MLDDDLIDRGGRQWSLPADCERRERQRQEKNDEALRGVFPRRRAGGWRRPLPAAAGGKDG